MFLQGTSAEAPIQALQVLDIVLRQLPTSRYSPVGRSFYHPTLGRVASLGEGLESWNGFHQCLRPTQMGLSLNIDLSSTAFIEPLPVIEFVSKLLKRDITTSTALSDVDHTQVKKALMLIKVEVTHRGNMRRQYRVAGLSSQATSNLTFDIQGTLKTVPQYFQEEYGFFIRNQHLPSLQVFHGKGKNYLPLEVCKIVKGQQYQMRLNERQFTSLLKETSQRPSEREKDIVKTVGYNTYDRDEYAKEFGIKISDNMAQVEARVLPAPRLKYQEKDCQPQVGQWSMVDKKVVDVRKVNNWICVSFSSKVCDSKALAFFQELARIYITCGIKFNLQPVLPTIYARPDQVERELKARFSDAMSHLDSKKLDLLIVILPNKNGSLYGDVKRICETGVGIISQCYLAKTVLNTKMSKKGLSDTALKINAKIGGRNSVLVDAMSRRMPLVSEGPTIIFGADVNHPCPGDHTRASIAAVVASQDGPKVTKYVCRVSVQAHRQELIQDLFKTWKHPRSGTTMTGGMVKELLLSFRKATGEKPQRIIFYRDGVRDGQFDQVLMHEIDAIRKACASLDPNYQPPITFVVVQKRHHTRLFTNNHNDSNSVDRSGNVLPGTVVDSKICHPTEFDFYLCSHGGIQGQGTTRPAHYHVLWDENKFTVDALQSLTNDLCYTYAKCTRSVSLVTPVYYAHLAAYRARFYIEPQNSDVDSLASAAPANADVRPLPPLKENVKNVMFYC